MQSYEEAALLLDAFTGGKPYIEVTRVDIEEFLGDQLTRHRPASAAVRYRALRRFYNWMVREEILDKSPMAGMNAPTIPEDPVPILTDAEITALLKVTSGKGFDQRRDHAMIRLFLDTGVRLGEMAGLKLEDVDLDVHDAIYVVGAGSRPRAVVFDAKTGTALDNASGGVQPIPCVGPRVRFTYD